MTDGGCGNQARYHEQSRVPGAFYAPFVVDRYTTSLPSILSDRRARIYWLVSTWDPYQVSIIRTDLSLFALDDGAATGSK
jgi:hypothetical protein